MNPSEKVLEISKEFMEDSRYVKINEKVLDKNCNVLKKQTITILDNISKYPDTLNDYQCVLYELFASSINYCYWYGRCNIRPSWGGASLMYKLLDEAVIETSKWNGFLTKNFIETFSKKLMIYRFPLIEERINHLEEIYDNKNWVWLFSKELCEDRDGDVQKYLSKLIEQFSGFAQDIFLKRAQLFFMQLNRNLGFFQDSINTLTIAADYQLPKVLRNMGIIEYNQQLFKIIDNEIPIPKHSRMECEIRSATILSCDMICKKIDCNSNELDLLLWLRGQENINEPFHLTLTTDY